MRYHQFFGQDYVERADYEAVVERARALDNELALVRYEQQITDELGRRMAKVVSLSDYRDPQPAA